jgi:CRISPR-associated protein Cas8b1/Cst1 subtype I-B
MSGMDMRFYVNDWLTASAGVGLIKVLENARIGWEDFVEGNTIKLPEEIFGRLGELYGEYITNDFTQEHLSQLLQNREDVKIYNSLVFPKIADFFQNSPITNPSSTEQVNTKFRNILGKEYDTAYLYREAVSIIKDFINNAFQDLLGKERSNKLCFFCGERKAYIKDKEVKVFDATNFTPLAASLNTVENFFWNGRSSMYLCPECEIFLYFSAFGFYRVRKGLYIFVYLPSLEDTFKMNADILETEGSLNSFINRVIVEASKRIEERKAEWILQNIYVVELEKVGQDKANVYSLSISPRLARAIRDMIEEYPERFGKDLFNIFLEYAYSGRDLYELLLKILSGFFFKERYKNLRGREAVPIGVGKNFKDSLPYKLTFFIKFQEVLNMEDKDRVNRQVNWAYSEGLSLREEYLRSFEPDRAKRKIEGISYRLLDAIRRKDTDAFQQNLIRAYLEVEREIPYIFVEALKDVSFNRIAYAFLIGLNGRGREEGGSEEVMG